jgi:hypothetical protein
MFRTTMLCLLAGTAGCLPAGGPLSYTASIPTPRESAFSCAFRAVNELGFTVTNADQSAGFIAAEKATAVTAGPLTEVVYHDRLTVAVFDADNATRTLRVTAAHAPQTARVEHARTRPPSSHGTAAARMLMQTCAPGTTPVLQRAGAAFQLQAPVAE